MGLLTDCKCWLKCDDDQEDTIVINEVGDNWSMAGGNTEQKSYLSGISNWNNCFELDGWEDYLLSPDTSQCDVTTGDFTAAIGFRYTTPEVAVDMDQVLFYKRVPIGGIGYDVRFKDYGSQLVFTCESSGGEESVEAGSAYMDGQDHLAIIERVNGVLHFFIDDVEVGTPISCSGSLSNVTPARIGFRSGQFGFWEGRVDQFMFWPRALSANERTWLWNGGAGQALLSDMHHSIYDGYSIYNGYSIYDGPNPIYT